MKLAMTSANQSSVMCMNVKHVSNCLSVTPTLRQTLPSVSATHRYCLIVIITLHIECLFRCGLHDVINNVN